MSEKVNPKLARRCRPCTNLVTLELHCPLCFKPTTAHPEARERVGYCQGCADGPFPLEEMHLVTWHENPYAQTEDGDLYYLCPKCWAKQNAEGEES